MLSTQSIFFMPRQSTLQQAAAIARGRFTSVHGDHMTYYNVWRAFDEVNHSKVEDATGKKKPSQLLSHKQRERERRWCEENFVNYRSMSNARDVRHQLISLYESASQTAESDASTDLQASGSGERVEAENSEIIRKCFLAGYFLQAAQRQADGSYMTLSDRQTVYIHPSSALHRRSPTCVFYHELVATSKQYLRDVSAVEERWLADVAPRSYRQLANLQSVPK
jgi:HrpA-like RNA helicase